MTISRAFSLFRLTVSPSALFSACLGAHTWFLQNCLKQPQQVVTKVKSVTLLFSDYDSFCYFLAVNCTGFMLCFQFSVFQLSAFFCSRKRIQRMIPLTRLRLSRPRPASYSQTCAFTSFAVVCMVTFLNL